MNKVFLLGNLGKDPEVKYIPSGSAVAIVSLATKERYKQGDEWKEYTEWHTVKIWGKQAEWVAEAKKGDGLFVEGSIKTESWEGSDGVKKYRTYVNARGELRVIPRVASEPKGATEPKVDNDIPF